MKERGKKENDENRTSTMNLEKEVAEGNKIKYNSASA
jgi:hypothetical protein